MNKISKFLNVNLIYIPKKKEVILFIIPIFVYILYIFNAIPSFYYGFDANIFMALYSATVGYKYVEPYISKVKNNVGDTLLTVILIMIAKGFLLGISFFYLTLMILKGYLNIQILLIISFIKTFYIIYLLELAKNCLIFIYYLH